MDWQLFLYLVIGVTGALNLIRLIVMILSTDAHDIKNILDDWQPYTDIAESVNPHITVVIPAYNEEVTLLPTIESVVANTYNNFNVVVVDDGSRDNTAQIARDYIKEHKLRNKVKVITQKNGGKAAALNNALKNHCKGELMMCLDADSTLAPDALSNVGHLFRENPQLIAMPSNVSVRSTSNILLIAQKYEYFLSYRLKRGLSMLGIEYIVGGVGSTFRRDYLKEIGGYDEDTITEDIDLTLKILKNSGSRSKPIMYGYNVYSFTQGVKGFRDLVKQRYRWKYGRMQAFFKHKELFFNKNKKHTKKLTFYQLPYAIFGELILLIEPFLITGIFVASFLNGSYISILIIFMFVIGYTVGAVISDDSIQSRSERIKLILLSPLAFVSFYILTTVELIALIKCLRKLPELKSSIKNEKSSWEHVSRYASIH